MAVPWAGKSPRAEGGTVRLPESLLSPQHEAEKGFPKITRGIESPVKEESWQRHGESVCIGGICSFWGPQLGGSPGRA